ncbi:MAG: polysaccharide biosynthesis/export family protein [Prevotellaceae bacterium]|nr:polysaccharide biosynthesis/export family protein [Prevotella sp.]MDD7258147.1 polysaccharide biosynthesis/export family protein [Prevotellaceae bacterium]MDY6130990.1 polysaccharide biosynthesis/export family protein [Prevotella sp.]
MKRILFPIVIVFVSLFLSSCGSTKKIVYFQGADTINLAPSRFLYDARIMPKDMLIINVSTTDPEAAKPFNINYQNMQGAYNNTNGINMYGYLVDNEGKINFPMVGSLHVEGMTSRECEALILEKIRPYMAKTETPIVTVRMSSYHVTVIGEAGSRIVPVSTEKMNIVEALASAGDLSIYGRRDNILLIRTDKYGEKSTHRLDISKADILNSPYYYLQQNDIIYIEPNKTKINSTAINNASIWFGALGMVTSLSSLIVAILK